VDSRPRIPALMPRRRADIDRMFESVLVLWARDSGTSGWRRSESSCGVGGIVSKRREILGSRIAARGLLQMRRQTSPGRVQHILKRLGFKIAN